VNSTSIYAGHPERRPTIPAGLDLAVVGAHNPVTLGDGDTVSVDVLDVGSLLPGRFLVCAVRLEQIVAVTDG
jgi:hypothetical protein